MNEILADNRVITFLRTLPDNKTTRGELPLDTRKRLGELDEQNPLNALSAAQFRELLRLYLQTERLIRGDRMTTKTSIELEWWLRVLDGEITHAQFQSKCCASELWDWHHLAVGLRMPALPVCCYMRMRRDAQAQST